MEERQRKGQFVPFSILFLAFLEELVIKLHERFFKVGFYTPGRFEGKFAAVLKDGDREVVCRHRSQEQSKVGAVSIVLVETHNNLLQTGHPTFGEMAVGEKNPVSVNFSSINQFFSLFALTLTKRYH